VIVKIKLIYGQLIVQTFLLEVIIFNLKS
jgi:hypothetical protein